MKRRDKIWPDRLCHLKALTEEFYAAKNLTAKRETLANLANFAYNPINYDFLRSIGIVDLFVHALSLRDEALVKFALAGLCNLSAETTYQDIIEGKVAIPKIASFLYVSNMDVVLLALTTLYFLISPKTISVIACDQNLKRVKELQKNSNQCISNMAQIFLETAKRKPNKVPIKSES